MTGDAERSAGTQAFLRALEAGEPAGEALVQAFGMGLKELETLLRAYVNQPTFPIKTLTIDGLPELPEPAVRELPAGEADRLLETFLTLTGGPRSP